jgi:hypothetical protein
VSIADLKFFRCGHKRCGRTFMAASKPRYCPRCSMPASFIVETPALPGFEEVAAQAVKYEPTSAQPSLFDIHPLHNDPTY